MMPGWVSRIRLCPIRVEGAARERPLGHLEAGQRGNGWDRLPRSKPTVR